MLSSSIWSCKKFGQEFSMESYDDIIKEDDHLICMYSGIPEKHHYIEILEI